MWRGFSILERESNLYLYYFSHNLETNVLCTKIAGTAADLFSKKYMKEIGPWKQMIPAQHYLTNFPDNEVGKPDCNELLKLIIEPVTIKDYGWKYHLTYFCCDSKCFLVVIDVCSVYITMKDLLRVLK